MRLDENKSKVQPEPTQIVKQAKRQLEYRKVGDHFRQVDGGKIWKINKVTREVSEALYRASTEINLKDLLNGAAPDKIDTEPGHWYVEALNKTNALKKLKQGKIILST